MPEQERRTSRSGAAVIAFVAFTTVVSAHPTPPASPASPAPPAVPALPAPQIPFDQAVRDLASPDTDTRLRTVQMLKDAAYAEAAVPVARVLGDPDDQVQLEAIATELNIFLAEKVVTRKKVALVVEKRTAIVADAAFTLGPLALGPRTVPAEVLTALRAAARDDNPRVGLEALYAFGTLAVSPVGAARAELLRTSAPDLASMLGAVDPGYRYAALRVIGRLFARRTGDAPVATAVGDPVIAALNDSDIHVRAAATEALGVMRYERALQGLSDLYQYYGKGDLAAASLDAIARTGHRSSAPVLSAQLSSSNVAIKGIAVEGLARIGDRTKWADIQGALNGERNDAAKLAFNFAAVRLADGSIDPIVDALVKPKLHDQAFGYLIELADGNPSRFVRRLQDPMPRVRADLIDALGLSYDPSFVAVVAPMMADPDADVARSVERALARLRGPQ